MIHSEDIFPRLTINNSVTRGCVYTKGADDDDVYDDGDGDGDVVVEAPTLLSMLLITLNAL